MTEYRITKETCEKGHEGRVCSRCGKPIQALETVDNARNPTYWSGCQECGYFDNGVTPRVYDIAGILYGHYRLRPHTSATSEDIIKGEQMHELCRMVQCVEGASDIHTERMKEE